MEGEERGKCALQQPESPTSVDVKERYTVRLLLAAPSGWYKSRFTGAAHLLALGGALLEVLLEGLALCDGTLLAEGVVLGGNGGGVLGVGLGGATPGGVVGHITGVLGGGLGEEAGHAALQRRNRR